MSVFGGKNFGFVEEHDGDFVFDAVAAAVFVAEAKFRFLFLLRAKSAGGGALGA